MPERLRKDGASVWICRIAALLFPLAAFWWIVPWISPSTIGNDYVAQPIEEQMVLQYSVRSGTFPLYVPGYAGGQSATALTLGQLFHPLSNLAVRLPGYWSGAALDWNTALRLLSLGMALLALFEALRRLCLSPMPALLLSGIAVYNLRMLDLFRYGAALETYTGFVFLVAASIWFFWNSERWFAAAPVAGAVYWLVCSGHPQQAYYALLGVAAVVLVLPFLARSVASGADPEPIPATTYWRRISLPIGLGLLLSSAYALPFAVDFLPSNAGRVGAAYSWTAMHPDTLAGLANNFFYPLRTDVHGVFGGSSLWIVAALLPLVLFFRIRIPGAVWALWGASLLAFLYMFGPRTFVHPLAYRFLPFADAIRIPGRISIVLPVMLVLILVWVVQDKGFTTRRFGPEISINAQVILSLLALVAMAAYCALPPRLTSALAAFPAVKVRAVPAWLEGGAFAAGAASVAALALHGLERRRFAAAAVVSTLCAALQIGLLLPYGTWVEARLASATAQDIASAFRRSLNYPVGPAAYMYHEAVARQLEEAFLEPALGSLRTRVTIVRDPEEAFRILRQKRSLEDVAIEARPGSAVQAVIDADPCSERRVRLVRNTFNDLVFAVDSCGPAVFDLSFPFSGHWRAQVNGVGQPVYRIDGGQNGVIVPAGASEVEFRYWSYAAYAGVLAGLAGLALLAVHLARRRWGRRAAVTAAVVSIAAAWLAARAWSADLYAGRSFGTDYVWSARPPAAEINLAYGKRAQMSPTGYDDQLAAVNHASRAVDGDRRRNSGLVTKKEVNPHWMLDLDRRHSIERIDVYVPFALGPIDVFVSSDKKNWRFVAMALTRSDVDPVVVRFDPPLAARYLEIRGRGKGQLALDEVEVYGGSDRVER